MPFGLRYQKNPAPRNVSPDSFSQFSRSRRCESSSIKNASKKDHSTSYKDTLNKERPEQSKSEHTVLNGSKTVTRRFFLRDVNVPNAKTHSKLISSGHFEKDPFSGLSQAYCNSSNLQNAGSTHTGNCKGIYLRA